MGGHSRYNVTRKSAGMSDGILKNRLGIKDQKTLDDAETILLLDSYTYFFGLVEKEKLTFDFSLILQIHKYFLGTLYSWAGKIRTVDISKEDMLFAPVAYIKISLGEFENILSQNIPTVVDGKRIIVKKLACIHNEFNAVHPFREGNGRTIRLFLDLLANDVGYLPIDWNKKSHREYIGACKKGMVREHDAMEKIIYAGLKKDK